MLSAEQELLTIYEQKAEAEGELRSRYFSVGSSLPIKLPPLRLTPDAMREIEAAEDETRAAYATFIEACRAS